MARRVRLTFHGTLLVLILTVLGLMAAAPARQAYEQQEQIEREEARLATLGRENARLEQRLQRLEDPDYVEKLAREQLGLVRPGEISYVVVPGPTPTQTYRAPAPASPPWYRRAWRWLKAIVGAG